MPQVDLSSVCAGAGGIATDRKVACETTAEADDPSPPPLQPAIDYAPESFYLSKDAELEWLDQNAFMERKNSGKGTNSTTSNPNPNANSNSNSIYGGSQRLKSKASILSLPNPQKQNYAGAKSRRSCKPTTIRLFPKRSESINRKSVSEPSSPKVSCMGRVRSRKDRKKPTEPKPPVLVKTNSVKKRKPGFWSNFRSMFTGNILKTGCKGVEPEGEPVVPVRKKGLETERRKCDSDSSESVVNEPPGLGAMNRFASGRRSDGWASEMEMEMKSEPVDRSPIWRRREKEVAPAEVNVIDRDWQAVGPATV